MTHDNELLEKLTRIETLLTTLVGVNGNNGRFGDLRDQVDEHQSYIDQQKGAGRIVNYGITAGVAAVTAWATKYLGK